MFRDVRDLLRYTGATAIVSNALKIRARRNRKIIWPTLLLIAMFLGLSAHLVLAEGAQSEGSSAISAEASQHSKPPTTSAPEEHRFVAKGRRGRPCLRFPITTRWSLAGSSLGLVIFVRIATRRMDQVPSGAQNF
jgi:hypothetical protein